MGYMGLSHWVDSDAAADFHFVLQKTPKNKIREIVLKELEEPGNGCNTCGAINIALVMETEGNKEKYENKRSIVFSNILNKSDFKQILDKINEKINLTEQTELWDNEKNRLWHLGNYQRLYKLVESKNLG